MTEHPHGPGGWGPPADPQGAVAVLDRAVEMGVTFGDTADSYGPGRGHPIGLPRYRTQCAEMSLRRLEVETIDLFQLHPIDRRVPLAGPTPA